MCTYCPKIWLHFTFHEIHKLDPDFFFICCLDDKLRKQPIYHYHLKYWPTSKFSNQYCFLMLVRSLGLQLRNPWNGTGISGNPWSSFWGKSIENVKTTLSHWAFRILFEIQNPFLCTTRSDMTKFALMSPKCWSRVTNNFSVHVPY